LIGLQGVVAGFALLAIESALTGAASLFPAAEVRYHGRNSLHQWRSAGCLPGGK
jgi:hypothetical protein